MSTLTFSWNDGSNDHFYIDIGSGTGNGQISVTSDNNNSRSPRSTTVDVRTTTGTTITRVVTITQDASSNVAYYSIDLKNQWVLDTSISNPNSSLYRGVFKSDSNYHVANSTASMTITINGYTEFKVYIRSYAESTYDYTMASTLDGGVPSSSSSANCYAHTKNDHNTGGTTLNDYKEVTYSNIDGGEHVITITYMKDQYEDANDDRGYCLIPWYDLTKATLTFYSADPELEDPQSQTQYAAVNDVITLPGQIFTKSGYQIQSWDDGDMLWNVGASYTVSGSQSFIAHWQQHQVTATELTSLSGLTTGQSISVLLMNTNGSNYIASSSNTTTVSTTTSQSTALGNSAYYWTLTKMSSTTYKLTNSAGYNLYSNQNSSLTLSTTNGTSWTTSYSSSNKWYFRRTSNSSYYLRLNGTTLQSSSSSTGRYWRIFQIT